MNTPDAAMGYASKGLPVFPLQFALPLERGGYVCSCGTSRCQNPAKHPLPRLAPKGLLNATTDFAIIREWWSIAPQANIGLATGRIIVLDVDPRHGGDEAVVDLETQHGTFPPTWRALTGGGGEHIYFATPDVEIRNSAGRLGPGLDIRGAGGYVVAPPSVHISGRHYAWSVDHHPDEVPLSRLPDWLVQSLVEPSGRQARPAEEWRRLVRDGVDDGGRNNALAQLTGLLLRRHIDPMVTLDLVQAWNSVRCRPPLSEDEVTRTVDSIARKECERREANIGQR